jgi:hypothetical protein
MKRSYSLFLVAVGLLLGGLNVSAQDAPKAGEKFRITDESGDLYLTYDADWNAEGWNLFYLDSLYTSPSSGYYTMPYENRDPEDVFLDTYPEKQIFTFINPDPYDPEIWAIETEDGRYLAVDTRNTWDITAGFSADDPDCQLFFEDLGWDMYGLKFRGLTTSIAADRKEPGISIGKYDDGWEHAVRSFIYRDKPATQGIWFFVKVGGSSGIQSTTADKNLSVFPTVASETLTVNAENGTKIAVYSVTGSKVIDTVLDGPLNVSSLNQGIYIITVPTGEKAKFIKN